MLDHLDHSAKLWLEVRHHWLVQTGNKPVTGLSAHASDSDECQCWNQHFFFGGQTRHCVSGFRLLLPYLGGDPKTWAFRQPLVHHLWRLYRDWQAEPN